METEQKYRPAPPGFNTRTVGNVQRRRYHLH